MSAATSTTRPKGPGTLAGAALFALSTAAAFALGEPRYVAFEPQPHAFALVAKASPAPLMVDPGDYPGVVRVAHDLQSDIERVTGLKATLASTPPAGAHQVVVVGTVGHSALVDGLVRRGKLDVALVQGRWEAWVTEVIANPWPGVDEALVIAGSDKRGAIYGTYDLSEQIGVSPWYWWADVVPDHHDTIYVRAGRTVHGSPAVKYRGIFLNDEAPDLTNWIRAKFGDAPQRENPPVPAGVANYGRAFYARIFEVMLRLRANYLWPAMWNNAFNEDDPENARLADDYGIVMGTSHQEPMLRAQKEWDRRYLATIGAWNYAQRPDLLDAFWREGVRRNQGFESIVTLGLRGANDTEMAPGGPAANRALLEHIVERQRQILREEINPDLRQVPQVWCLYKEVQDYYDAGMRAPDDVTLLWAEDNWGNVRRLPTADERKRSGGAGVYYHFDYHGGPRSYQWLNTNPLPKIWDQMSLAYAYGADRIWIVNVGHFKGYEVPTEFFLNLAWNPQRWNGANVNEFLTGWATREFGAEHAAAIADLVAKYAKYNGRRKPELLAPDTYSLVDYNEAETVVAGFADATAEATRLYRSLPAAKRDAFFELVLFPTVASGLVNDLYLAAERNAVFAAQGRASAGQYAKQTTDLFHQYLSLVSAYDRLARGKWTHFMEEPVLGYTTWRDPPANNLDHLRLVTPRVGTAAGLGVAIEGSASAWPGAAQPATLPRFDAVNRQQQFVDVFNRGKTSFEVAVVPSAPWVRVRVGGTPLAGHRLIVDSDRRLWISIDWHAVPEGRTAAMLTLTGAGSTVNVTIDALRPTDVTRATLDGFVENAGVVSIEPEHATRNLAAGGRRWARIADYGRTLSGMRAEAPVDAPAARPGIDAPCLEYRMFLFEAGAVDVTAITAPTLNFQPNRALAYAVSFDDEKPQVVTLVPAGYKAQNGNRDWEKVVVDNARYSTSRHVLARPGCHTLKVWMIDPAVILQKLVVDAGGLKRSYLGPPESLRGTP